MNRSSAAIVLAVFVLAAFGYSPPVVFGQQSRADQSSAERRLRREITLLHLINGLELTTEQMRFILDRAHKIRDLREQLFTKEMPGETQDVLGKYREKLMNSEPIPPRLLQRVGALQYEKHELEYRIKADVTRITEEVQNQLEDFQLYALRDYIPCVIPPPGESKIGQAAGGGHSKILDWVRKLPDGVYQTQRLEIARRIAERIGHKVPLGFELSYSEEEELERIAGIFDQARALPEVGFAVQKEELAERIAAPYPLADHSGNITAKVALHMLDPAIIPLLEEKLAAGEH